MTEARVQVWFSNRRARLRKQLTGQQLGLQGSAFSLAAAAAAAAASSPSGGHHQYSNSTVTSPQPTTQSTNNGGQTSSNGSDHHQQQQQQQQVNAAVAAAAGYHAAGAWQHHHHHQSYYSNGYPTVAAAAGSIHPHHQEVTASLSFGHQFPGYLAANHAGWNPIPARKSEENIHQTNASSAWSSTASTTVPAVCGSTESYPFFSSATAHQHQLHSASSGSAFSVAGSGNSAAAAAAAAALINPHSPTEPKSGYPYYQHQMISGMEASHMLHCAGLVH